MAYQNVEVLELQVVHKKTWFQRFRNKLAVAGTTATALAVTAPANAAGLEDVGTAITAQITSAEGIITMVLVAAITITALIVGYKKINKGANAA